jgi:hypothetical protein
MVCLVRATPSVASPPAQAIAAEGDVIEQEWLTSTDAKSMLHHLWSERTNRRRKLRLFACAACRLTGGLDDRRALQSVEMAELFADGLVRKRQMDAARAATKAGSRFPAYGGLPRAVGHHLAWHAAEFAVARTPSSVATALLREIFGNPFRPVTANPAWLTSTVQSLVQAAYDERLLPAGTLHNDRFAVLADALLDAGCTDDAILDHLRGPGPHVRGCFLLDALLGKG